MRISEDRYTRDLRRLELARRMLHLEARTRTICTWTGVSRDRVRKLARASTPPDCPAGPMRHRGQSPHQIGYFFKSPRINAHASALACLCEMYEVLRPAPTTIPAQQFPSLARGENLCTAYEIYRAITLNSLISFEHGVLLATALAQGDELALNPCQECGGLFLIDRFAHHDERCEHCQSGVGDTFESIVSSPLTDQTEEETDPVQLSLFKES